jgi:type IV pilus assembly protein PilV
MSIKHRNPFYRKTNSQLGFSLFEVLVTLVVLAIGLLGLAALQATGLKQNHSAYHRSQATQFAYDITDRMRSNKSAINNYLSSFMLPTVAVSQASCLTTGCTSAQMAQHDLFEWNSNLTSYLPNGTGTITVNGSTYTITVSWDDNRDGVVNSDDPNIQASFQP